MMKMMKGKVQRGCGPHNVDLVDLWRIWMWMKDNGQDVDMGGLRLRCGLRCCADVDGYGCRYGHIWMWTRRKVKV